MHVRRRVSKTLIINYALRQKSEDLLAKRALITARPVDVNGNDSLLNRHLSCHRPPVSEHVALSFHSDRPTGINNRAVLDASDPLNEDRVNLRIGREDAP